MTAPSAKVRGAPWPCRAAVMSAVSTPPGAPDGFTSQVKTAGRSGPSRAVCSPLGVIT